MTGLMMWNLGEDSPQVENPDKARVINPAIREDDADTKPSEAPDWNEKETDDSPDLMGLSKRQQASYHVPSEKYVPMNMETATALHNVIIDGQVATSGTAASREASGVQGHGTLDYGIALDPVLREGMRFGNTYFEINQSPIQDGAGHYLEPVTTDNWATAVVANRAVNDARTAARSTLYGAFLKAGM